MGTVVSLRAQRKHNTRHHRKPQSLGGDNSPENISIVPAGLHESWHHLFSNLTPEEIAKLITDVWLDPAYEMVAVRIKP